MCALTGIIIYCVVTGKVLGDDKKKKDESGFMGTRELRFSVVCIDAGSG